MYRTVEDLEGNILGVIEDDEKQLKSNLQGYPTEIPMKNT